MTTLRRFLFDNTFDDDQPLSEGAAGKDNEVDAAAEAAPEVVAPTFTEADVKAAHDQAFAAGREDGLRAAGDTIEQRCSGALTVIAEQLGVLFQTQATAAEQAAKDAAAVAVAMTRKLVPALAERGAVEEVERLVAEAMELVREEPRVVIRVHASLRDALAGRIEALTSRYGFEGQIVLNTGTDLEVSDCQIDWTSGGAARDMAALWRELDDIVARNLGDAAVPPSGPAASIEGDGNGDDTGPPADSAAVEPRAAGTDEPS